MKEIDRIFSFQAIESEDIFNFFTQKKRFILGDNLNQVNNHIHEYDKDNILDLKFGVYDNTRVDKVGVNNST